MVEELRLWAIDVDVFRQCFAAPPDLADRLRRAGEAILHDRGPGRPATLLSKIGPLRRHPPEGAVIRPGVPNRHDCEAMMTSRYIGSDRLDACWVLAQAWLDDLGRAKLRLPLARSQIDEYEFDLVRNGVPTQLSIRHLWQHSLGIPLRPRSDMSAGYMTRDQVPRLVEEWSAALDELHPATAGFAQPLLEFAGEHHTTPASDTPPAAPAGPVDLVACWTAH